MRLCPRVIAPETKRIISFGDKIPNQLIMIQALLETRGGACQADAQPYMFKAQESARCQRSSPVTQEPASSARFLQG